MCDAPSFKVIYPSGICAFRKTKNILFWYCSFYKFVPLSFESQEATLDWSSYEARISALEKASIQAAPVLLRPLAGEPFTYFPAELVVARWKAHGRVLYIAERLAQSLAKANVADESVTPHFAECLSLACFELRNRCVESWPGFALVFHKMFGPAIWPWLPSLFLAAVALPHTPRPEFDLEEVLGFSKLLQAA